MGKATKTDDMNPIPLKVEAAFLMHSTGLSWSMIARILGVKRDCIAGWWLRKYGWKEWVAAHKDLTESAADILARQAAVLSVSMFGNTSVDDMTDVQRKELAREMLRVAERLRNLSAPRRSGRREVAGPETKKEEPKPKDLSLDDVIKGASHAGRIPEDQVGTAEKDEGAGDEVRQEVGGADLEQHGQQG